MEEIKEEKRNDENDRNERSEDLEILEIVNSIEEGRPEALGRRRVPGKQPCTIYQVSKIMRQVNEKCYEPQLVSIGPYHRGKEGLKAMEEKKFEHLLAIVSRNPKLKLKDYVKEIRELEADARSCYSESISLPSKEFVKMMVFDGCFLVEMFLRIRKNKMRDELWLPHFMTRDMLLLENQLPFFILQRIFSLVVPQKRPGFIKDLLLNCFRCFYLMPLNEDAAMKESYHHVLDMFHHHCLPTHRLENNYAEWDEESDSESDSDPDSVANADGGIKAQSDPDADIEAQYKAKQDPDMEPKSSTNPNADPPDITEGRSHNARCSTLASSLAYVLIKGLLWQLIWKWLPTNSEDRLFAIPTAEELQEAGIKFERKVEPAGSFLDVEFDKKGKLKIPYLYFSGDLQTVLQNLIAYEQWHPKAGTFFTGYARFMDHLINTAKDIQILRHAGILEHGLGSDDELARHFNELCRRIFFNVTTVHLYSERMAINDYCRKSWPTWRAKLMRNYFNSPWSILSLIAAVLLVLLTITQTVFSIIATV